MASLTFTNLFSGPKVGEDDYKTLAHQLDMGASTAEKVFLAALDIARDENLISKIQHWRLSDSNGRRGKRARAAFSDEFVLSDGPVTLDVRLYNPISKHATRISNETGFDVDKLLEGIGKVINWIVENEDQIKKVIEVIMRLVALVG